MRDVAVVGMACRLPGGLDDIDLLLSALQQRTVTAGPVPADRWDASRYYASDEAAKGKAYVNKANFLKQDVRTMDAEFFDFPPKVAENLDPQQRLLLELIWEAFENAGLDLPGHAGRKVGVYVGGFMLDHMITLMQVTNRARHNANTAAGMMMTMLSNRLSHAFDLRGPSLSIDTACSSSLVAFSYACRDIWSGDCDMAVVGGVNVMTRPEYSIGMCKGQFLSRDGQCKSFDARGDGYGRGEGAGIVVLKTLERALADGDTILATVAGAGVNSDGRTPGISMPSAEAQSLLIREVCDKFEIDPAEVRYVECHGTGTAVGDPIEANSIGAVYGAGRRGDDRVVLGSIKSNIGHLEAAAGVAGVIKAVLTLQHRKAFPLGNLQTPHEGIPFEDIGVQLADREISLARPDESFLVAVNSFGYGGTNAHVLLRSASPEQAAPRAQAADGPAVGKPDGFPLYLPLSTRSAGALKEQALRYGDLLAQPDANVEDVLFSAAWRRTRLSHRAVVMGRDASELLEGLASLAQGEKSDKVVTGQQAAQGQSLPVWVFTGMGPQWWGMGQELYRDDPVYRTAVDEADRVFQGIAGFSILAKMLASEAESEITRTAYAQPANFIVQWGLAAMLKAAGVTPGAVVGHSVGEVTAAAVSGALSLEDALRVSYHRSRLQTLTAGTGSMLAVGMNREAAAEWLRAYEGQIEIAAVNGPATLTLSGDTAAINALAAQLSEREVFNRVLTVEVPYHSHLMDPILADVVLALTPIVAREPSIPLYSTVTGQRSHGPSCGADYWPQNIRRPVAFMAAVNALLDDGFVSFVEVGPHPVLSSALRDSAKAKAKELRLVETLRRNEAERSRVHRAVAQVFASGCDIDWTALNGRGKTTALPNYPWQRERHWLETERAAYQRLNATESPMLGCEQFPAAGVWTNDLEHEGLAYLSDHIVSGTAIMPAAGYVETLLEAAAALHPEAAGWYVRDLEIQSPLLISNERATDYVSSYDRDTRKVSVHTLEGGKNGEGLVHTTGRVGPLRAAEERRVDLVALKAALDAETDVTTFYRDLSRIGLQYGPVFKTLQSVRVDPNGGRVLALIEGPAELDNDGYRAHPALLDACFQVMVGMLEDREITYLPTGFQEFRLLVPQLPTRYWCQAVSVKTSGKQIDADLTLMDDAGSVLAIIRGLRVTASTAKPARTDDHGDPVKLQMGRYEWSEAVPVSEPKRMGHWLIVEDAAAHELNDHLAIGIEAMGARVVGRLQAGSALETQGDQLRIRPGVADDVKAVLAAVGALDGIVFAHGVEASLKGSDPTGHDAVQLTLALTRQLAALPQAQQPRAYLITRAAFMAEDGDVSVEPAQTALNGFARVAFNEIEGLRFTSIDLPASADLDDIDACVVELVCDAVEDEVAIRRGRRLYSRFTIRPSLAKPLVESMALGADLHVRVRGLNERDEGNGVVKLVEYASEALAADEIELKVIDLALTMNALRNPTDDAPEDGFVEVLGTVAAVGAAVSDLRVGQRVYGLAPAEFASHLRGPRSAFHVVEVAADTPSAALLFVAAREASAERLAEQADLRAGARVLVEAGPAAAALAEALKRRGAEVTLIGVTDGVPPAADTDAARLYAANQDGIEAAVAERTGGKGFDALVGSMEHWGATFGWSALAAGGVLVDTDARARPLTVPRGASAIVRADTALLTNRAERYAVALHNAVARSARGELEPTDSLPMSIIDFASKKLALPEADIPLIVNFSDATTKVQVHVRESIAFKADATYLVTGGFGGFGQKTARWLVERGARHLVLAGRSGADTPERKAFADELRAMGADVVAVGCDLANESQLRDLLATIKSAAPPLRGIFHAAVVMIDESIVDTDPAHISAIMRSKAESGRLLHELTQNLELDYFVLYSSVAGMLGNARQAGYVSANGFLDGLAWHRRAMGLPATSINWGAIGDVGMIARDDKLEQFMRYIGLRGMRSAEALHWMESAMRRSETQVAVSLMTSWAEWGRYQTLAAKSPRFMELVQADANPSAGAGDRLRAELEQLPAEERFGVVASLVAGVIADELETAAENIAIDRPILDLGVDSLMATEIQMLLDRDLGITVSVLEMLGDLTIRGIVDKTLRTLGLSATESAAEAQAA